jgi:hypothetical protein
MRTDADVDRLLRDEAAAWQRRVATGMEVDTGLFVAAPARQVPRSSELGVAAAAAVAAIVAVAYGIHWLSVAKPPVGAGSAGDTATTQPVAATAAPSPPAASQWSTYVVRGGDPVLATGWLIADRTGKIYLCGTDRMTLTGPTTDALPGCIGDLLRVQGIDSKRWGGQYATVRGRWDGSVLWGDEVTATEEPAAPSWKTPVPCEPPPGGWPGDPPSEVAPQALEREVKGHPGSYVGVWPATSDVQGQIVLRVMVVGTVEDVSTASTQLGEIYPYNLCVVSVDFSARDLQPVFDNLSALSYPWFVSIDPRLDRVLVSVIALTDSEAAAIARYDGKIEVRSALRPVH